MSSEQLGGQDPEQWMRDRLAEAGATIAVTTTAPPAKRRPPAWLAPAAAAAVVAAIIIGSLAWRHGTATDPAKPTGTPSISPTTVAPELVSVPDLQGLPEEQATELLDGLGLAADVRGFPKECPTLTVSTQHPAAGSKVAAGSQVAIKVACPNETEDMLYRVASRFDSAAHSRQLSLPIDAPVALYLGGRHVSDISAADSETWSAWDVCVDGYAGRTCPFNALELVTSTDDVSISTRTPEPPCTRWPGTPAELEPYHAVSLTVGSTCFDWGTVVLYVNDMGQIVAVDQVLDGP